MDLKLHQLKQEETQLLTALRSQTFQAKSRIYDLELEAQKARAELDGAIRTFQGALQFSIVSRGLVKAGINDQLTTLTDQGE